MSGTEAPTVIVERELPHPPEKIWRALTQPHLIAEWLMQNDFKPVVGHAFNFRAVPQPNWSGVIDCEVLAVEENRALSYTWGAMGLKTIVRLTLTPTKAGTQLRMEQTGFRRDQPQNFAGAKYGWQKFLTNLETLLDRTD
jgi:uncharacterized protein YndB with AHSA1/START domain